MYIEEIALENLAIINSDIEENIAERLKNIFARADIINSGGTVFITDSERKLYGIVTPGDYRRFLKTGNSLINRNFKKVLKNENVYDQIKAISNNPNIAIVPLVDENNVILSAYLLKSPKSNISAGVYMILTRLVSLRPDLMKKYLKKWKRILLYAKDANVLCMIGNLLEKVVEAENISYVLYDESTMINLFQCYGSRAKMYYETEDSGEDTLRIVLEPNIVNGETVTLPEFINEIYEYIESTGEKILDCDREIFDCQFTDIIEKYGVICKYVGIPGVPEMERQVQFYDSPIDRTRIYMVAGEPKKTFIEYQNAQKIVYMDGMFKVPDYKSKCVNFSNGRRLVPNYGGGTEQHIIYIIGPCVVRGSLCDDNHTIGAILQKMLPAGYKVELLGGVRDRGNYFKWLGDIKVKPGDYIFFIDLKNYFPKCDLDMTEYFRKLFDAEGQFFYDAPMHCNYKGMECIANAIYDKYFKSLPPTRSEEENVERVKMKEFAHWDIGI